MARPSLSVLEFLAASVPLDVQIERAKHRRNSKAAQAPTLLGMRLPVRRLSKSKKTEDRDARTAGTCLSSLLPCLTAKHEGVESSCNVLEDVGKDKYVLNQTLRDALQQRDTVLIKGSWLVKQWEAGKQGTGFTTMLRRQEIEAKFPAGIWSVSELFAGLAKGAVNIIAVSHSWQGCEHPDPMGENMDALCSAVSLMLKSTPLQDVALFIDYCSLHQLPRTVEQEASHSRAMSNAHLWYLHQCTRKWMLTKVSAIAERSQPFDYRAGQLLERALTDMVTSTNFMLDLGKLDDTCTTWQRLLDVCRHKRQPPALPDDFTKALHRRRQGQEEMAAFAEHKYEEAFLEAIAAAEELSFSSVCWGDDEARQIARILPLCGRLTKLALHGNRITEKGTQALIKAAAECDTLESLWLIHNPVSKAPKDVRERLLNSWEKMGRIRDRLRL